MIRRFYFFGLNAVSEKIFPGHKNLQFFTLFSRSVSHL